MPLTVDTITVKRPLETERMASGLLRPRMFRAAPEELMPTLTTLRVRRRRSGLLFISGEPARLKREAADQVYAREYERACRDLSTGESGRRAADLLFSHLSSDQVDTARRLGYFEQTIYDRDAAELMYQVGMPMGFHTLTVRFLRAYPNGNIFLNDRQGVQYQICLHPTEPYPMDDICLAQWTLLMADPDEFIKAGNVTPRVPDERGLGTGARIADPMRFTRMFQKRRIAEPVDLVLTHVQRPPVPDNVILAEG